MPKDYYNILGVEKKASAEEIKKAFRKLAHQHHPDKSTGDEAKFKEINEAYQVLGNEEKRQHYDQYGSTFDQQGGFGGGMDWNDFMKYARGGNGGAQNVQFDFGDLGDMFGDMFGFGGGQSRSRQRSSGHDMQTDVTIDFLEAAFGVKKELSFSRLGKCTQCKGNGAEPGTPIKTCTQCGGQGVMMQVQRTILGNMQTRVACPSCKGQGKIPEKPCSTCSGRGVQSEKATVSIDIPAGINHGESLRMSGQGESGEHGMPPGDLYVTVHVRPHDVFTRDGADIHSDVSISYTQAVLGAKVSMATIDGDGTLTIPEGTVSGTVFKVRGKGVPKLQGYGRGDQYVTVTIAVPKKVSRKQKELLEQLEKMD